MAKQDKTLRIIEAARAILAELHPMTLRQVYYQLVSRQVIENNRGQYQALSNALVYARREGLIAWDWLEDRLRRPRTVSMWADLSDFARTVQNAYRRDVWATQPQSVECWLEKDALSGVFESVLRDYGVTLNVGRGYDGWTSIKDAAERYGDGSTTSVLYFGDFDPSGEDMARSLRDRLADLGAEPDIVKCALTMADVRRYNLPPDMTKKTDTRRGKHIAQYGDVCVELDALPVDVLTARIRSEIEKRLDMSALAKVRQVEKTEREKLKQIAFA